jgi:hypothetical protein
MQRACMIRGLLVIMLLIVLVNDTPFEPRLKSSVSSRTEHLATKVLNLHFKSQALKH